MKSFKIPDQRGVALLPFVIVIPFLILITTYFMDLAVVSFRLAKGDQLHTHAQFTTDAAIDFAMQQINEDENWTGTGSEIELHNDGKVRTTYQVTVVDDGPDKKIITSVGRSYSPVGSATPDSSVTINVELRPVRSGEFSIVTGVGGLYMSNSSKIVGGDVYVNGEISLQNSAQIGLTTNPISVKVAHQTCPNPPDSSYPRVCNSGENGQPISIQNNAHIYGSVEANNQTDGSDMSDPGLTASSGVAAQSLPAYDRDAQKAAVATEITGSAASCSGSQTRTWAANTKINGSVSVSNGCEVTVQGNVWITGQLTVQNSAQILIADSLGTTMPTIMIDDDSGLVIQNSGAIVANASSTGAQVITYWSEASCSPDCADVTGGDLDDSRDHRTILLQNGAEANESIMYARWTQVELGNGGNVGAVIGQTVRLTNSATITFETSTGGTTATFWVIDNYRRSFD